MTSEEYTAGNEHEFVFYWGGASGSARKALRQLGEPNVMLNYATKLNEPWNGIERLFVDCGGYSFMKGMGEYQTSDAEYLDYVSRVDAEKFALRDYPCEPDLRRDLGRTVTEHQQMTAERHISLADQYDERGMDALPVTVLQGWFTNDYLDHLDDLRDHGVLFDDVAIGTLCGRKDRQRIRQIVTSVRSELGGSSRLHAFGVKLDALQDRETLAALDSADSNAFDFDERKVRTRGGDPNGRTWRDVAFYYLKHKRQLRARIRAMEGMDPSELRDSGQQGLEEIA